MVKSIKFLKDWRCFSKGDKIELRPGINLLVGDQGCGKSSLLLMLNKDGYLGRDKIATVNAPKGTTSYFLDFEKDNIRGMDATEAAMRGIPIGALAANLFASHGQSVNATLRSMPKDQGAVVLNDEPDMALSMRSIRKLSQTFTQHVAELNQQMICSCHNPYLMELIGDVYSLEHRRWMPYLEFHDLMALDI